jgi:hypothetical protein
VEGSYTLFHFLQRTCTAAFTLNHATALLHYLQPLALCQARVLHCDVFCNTHWLNSRPTPQATVACTNAHCCCILLLLLLLRWPLPQPLLLLTLF